MYEGEIVGELNPKETTVQELGLYMAGAKRNNGVEESASKAEEIEIVDDAEKVKEEAANEEN